jgi:hypothetical protein
MSMIVDPKCIELARAFLSEIEGSSDADRDELAQEIQCLVDDYCAKLRDQLEGPAF